MMIINPITGRFDLQGNEKQRRSEETIVTIEMDDVYGPAVIIDLSDEAWDILADLSF